MIAVPARKKTKVVLEVEARYGGVPIQALIRERRAAGMPLRAIAAEMGISKSLAWSWSDRLSPVPPEPDLKRCRSCGIEKKLSEFHRANQHWAPHGRRAHCKLCSRAKVMKSYRKHAKTPYPGTRENRTTPRAACSPTALEIAWAAGFMEGEGSFSGRKPNVTACQVNPEPLARLARLFGGVIGERSRPPDERMPNAQPCGIWRVSGSRAIGVAMTLYGFLSEKRRCQAKQMIDTWMSIPISRPRT